MRSRPLALGLVAAVLLAACGKTGPTLQLRGSPRVAGVYHLVGAAEATNLELRQDGTFTLRKDSCDSSGVVACGDWRLTDGPSCVVTRDDLYWPTPPSFPSAVVRGLAMGVEDRELVVVGTSEWAGSFTQRWSHGRTCAVCGDHTLRTERPCAEPLPVCIRL